MGHMCGRPLGMGDIMPVSMESAEFGPEVPLFLAILTMQREEPVVTGEPLSPQLPRSQRLRLY